MSIQALAWVFEQSRSKGVARLVLLSLANHHNAGTGQCNPGQRRIAQEAGISPSTVSEAIGRLVDIGELEVAELGSGTRSSDYRLPWLSRAFPSGVEPSLALGQDRALAEPVALGSRAQGDSVRAASARSEPASARKSGSSARPAARNQEPEPRSAPADPEVVAEVLARSRASIGRPR